MNSDVRDPRRRRSGVVQSQGRRQAGKSLVVLDNPDDGEIAQTGDASDFAGEANSAAPANGRAQTQTSEQPDKKPKRRR